MRCALVMCCLLVAGLLQACGGGGGGDPVAGAGGRDPAPPTVPVEPVVSPTVAVASTVPARALGVVVRLVTSAGSGAWGAAVPVHEAGATGESRVMALDAQGDIVLAAISTDGRPMLDAQSTALALVRMAFGRQPTGMTSAEVITLVQAAPAYPGLVAAVQAALDAGTTVAAQAAVLQAVLTVAGQTGARAYTQAAVPSGRKHAQLLDPERVDRLPYVLASGVGSAASVYIVDPLLPGTDSIQVQNASLLQWSARTSTAEHAPLISRGSTQPDGSIKLDPSSPSFAFAESLGRLAGVPLLNALGQLTAQSLDNNQGRNLHLTVEQTDQTRTRNVFELVVDFLLATLPDGPQNPAACARGIAEMALPPGALAQLVASGEGAAVMDILKDQMKSIAWQSITGNLAEVVLACRQSDAKTVLLFAERATNVLVPQLGLVRRLLDVASNAVSLTVVTGRAYWLTRFFRTSDTVAVCQTPTLFGFRITNCTHRLQFKEPDLLLAPGAVKVTLVQALDVSEQPTGLPTLLEYSTQGGVSTYDVDSNTLRALVQGQGRTDFVIGAGRLKVKDPSTGVEGEALVRVTGSRIEPAASITTVGTTVAFSLRDALGSGRLVDHEGTQTAWTSEKPTVATLLPAPGFPSQVMALALRPGVTTIEAVNPFDPRSVMRAELTVQGVAAVELAMPSAERLVLQQNAAVSLKARPVPDDPAVQRPGGFVTLVDGAGQFRCRVQLSADGTATCSFPVQGLPGPNRLVARFEGDSIFAAQPHAGELAVKVLVPTVLVASQSGPAYLGSPMDFSASVQAHPAAASAASGTIDFIDEAGAPLCSALLRADANKLASATCAVVLSGAAGPRRVTARYAGDSTYAAASANLSFTASFAPASLVVPARLDNVYVEDLTRLSAGISATLPGGPTPSGTISFWTEDAVPVLLCRATVGTNGQAACLARVPGRPGTTLGLRAVYDGDAVYATQWQQFSVGLVSHTSHWAGTYEIFPVSDLAAPFGFAGENPPFSIGPLAGASRAFFRFSDTSSVVIMGAGTVTAQEEVRRIFELAWRSTDSTWVFDLPVSYPGFTGIRRTIFTVTQRSASSISGTVVLQTTAGVWTDARTVTAQLVPVTATGTWQASRVYLPLPATRMNGYDFCFSNNTAAPLGGSRSPSWAGGFVANACEFGTP